MYEVVADQPTAAGLLQRSVNSACASLWQERELSVPRRPNLLTPTRSASCVAALAQHAGQSGDGRPELWSTWADALLR